jgi:simple sugar transport system permease protein
MNKPSPGVSSTPPLSAPPPFWRGWLAHQHAPFQLGLALVLLLLVVIMAGSTSTFLTVGNILNVFRQAAPTLIVAVAMTLVITSGGIDLSVGSTLALVGVLSALLLSAGMLWWLVLLLMLLFGCGVGLVNGFLVTHGGLPPFIATLATLSVLRGVAQLITKGYSVPIPPNSPFIDLGRGFLLGIPYPIILAALALLLGSILFNRTRFGIYITAIGSNEEAVRRNGVNTGAVKVGVYIFAGLLTAAAGMITSARLASGSSYSGIGFELDVISAVVLGGTNLFGGDGTLLGAFLGTIILAVIGNGLILLHVSPFYEQIIKGVVLVIAIILNRGALARAFKTH